MLWHIGGNQGVYLEVVLVGQLPSCGQLFVTLWAAKHQASLSFTTPQSFLNKHLY